MRSIMSRPYRGEIGIDTASLLEKRNNIYKTVFKVIDVFKSRHGVNIVKSSMEIRMIRGEALPTGGSIMIVRVRS